MARTLPRKLIELGRIRIGDQEPNAKGGKRPHKLDQFRLTSGNKPLLHFAAQLYGGDVRAWEDAPNGDQWELYTAANSLDVLIPTASAVSVQHEIWGLSGCTLRCTGEFITHSAKAEQVGLECLCPQDEQQRTELAKDGKACARILRLNVLLPDLPGMGCWRLETKGYYATAELLGTLDMLQGAGMEHTIIEAVLRLEQRSVKRDGGTRRFNTPVLWPKYTPRQLLAGSSLALLEAPTPPTKALPAGDAIALLNAELFGDRTPPDARASAVGQQIDALLAALATDADAYWQKVRGTYPDLTPGALARVRDHLQAKLDADQAASLSTMAQAGQSTTGTTPQRTGVPLTPARLSQEEKREEEGVSAFALDEDDVFDADASAALDRDLADD